MPLSRRAQDGMTFTRIAGTGSYLPSHMMTNHDWAKRVETSHEWIVERTGIHSRRIAGPDETACTMAVEAATHALEAASIQAKDIELIIVATATPDKAFPSTACLVQQKLKIPVCIAFDVQAACSGFIYALSVADSFIKTGQVRNALIIGSEMMSRLINWSCRNTAVLFGDGAGAFVLTASDTPGVMQTKLYADGNHSDLLYVDNAQMYDHYELSHVDSVDNPSRPLSEYNPSLTMKGKLVFKHAVSRLGELIKEIQEDESLEPIDWLVPHQANIRIIQATAEKLNLPMDKVICTIETHANTSSASIPLALDTAVKDGRIQRGQNCLFEAFGAGLTWGSAFVKY